MLQFKQHLPFRKIARVLSDRITIHNLIKNIMHPLHGTILITLGTSEDLKSVPEVLISDAECVPIYIDGKLYWLVVDVLDTLSSNFATIANPDDDGEGTLDAVEVSVRTGVDSVEKLLRVLPNKAASVENWFRFDDPTKQDKAFPMWGYGTESQAIEYAAMDGVIFKEMDSSQVAGIAALPNDIPESRRFYISQALT